MGMTNQLGHIPPPHPPTGKCTGNRKNDHKIATTKTDSYGDDSFSRLPASAAHIHAPDLQWFKGKQQQWLFINYKSQSTANFTHTKPLHNGKKTYKLKTYTIAKKLFS